MSSVMCMLVMDLVGSQGRAVYRSGPSVPPVGDSSATGADRRKNKLPDIVKYFKTSQKKKNMENTRLTKASKAEIMQKPIDKI